MSLRPNRENSLRTVRCFMRELDREGPGKMVRW